MEVPKPELTGSGLLDMPNQSSLLNHLFRFPKDIRSLLLAWESSVIFRICANHEQFQLLSCKGSKLRGFSVVEHAVACLVPGSGARNMYVVFV